jgi:chromosome segregation ATPase
MKRVSVVVLVCGLVAVGTVAGCGARAEVAKEKIVHRIDSMLGSMDVKRKEAERSVAAMKEGLMGLRKAKIRAQVKHDQVQRKATTVEVSIGDIDDSLKTLRGHLVSNTETQIAGKTYSVSELNGLAKRLIKERDACDSQLAGFKQALSRLQKVSETLQSKQTDYEDKLTEIENQLAVIDSNRIALNAMKDAAEAMDGSEKSLAGNVAQLEEKVNDLYADVEAELMGEDARWSDSATRQELESVDAIVSAMQTADDTISRIDSIFSQSTVVNDTK